jgi:YHS domain-containing protein
MMNAKLLSLAIAVSGVAGCAKQEAAASNPPPSAPSVQASAAPAASTAPATSTAPTSSAPALPAGLTRVTDPSLTCMVNNQFMGRPQIPVQVGGKTYFGCCAMCKDRLANDASARTAVDPVSKRPVDKSTAVIARLDSGALVYFESEANLAAYSPR